MDRFYTEFSEFDESPTVKSKGKNIEYDIDENDPETYQPDTQDDYSDGYSETSEDDEDAYV
jgi:hypothetical protein